MLKAPDEQLDFTIDWSGLLQTDETIRQSDWSVTPNTLTLYNQTVSGGTTKTWVKDGVLGQSYMITNVIATLGGRTLDQSFGLVVATANTWANLADVAAIVPGATDITTGDILAAQSIIDLVSNRTVASSGGLRPRDIEWLKRAVAYQAVWMKDQDDLFSRSMVLKMSQDGVSVQLANKHDVYLAPLAARALKNCRWLRSRSLRPRLPFIDDTFFDASDDYMMNWRAM